MIGQKELNEPVLSLRNVGAYYWRSKGYLKRERFWALKDISFELFHGETLGVIGRNGAGKSTLLQLLAGITNPDKGTLVNYGFQPALLSLQLGFVQYLSGRENAILSGLLLGMCRADIKKKMAKIIQFSGLGDFFDQPIDKYSSGMRARLGFSVAFQLDPDILLIDEVFGVGDGEFRAKSASMIKEKIRSNKTVVVVSHNAVTIRDLCNRVVWIEEGITQAEGHTKEVVDAYEKFLKTRHAKFQN